MGCTLENGNTIEGENVFVAPSPVFYSYGRPPPAQKHGNIGGVQVVRSKGLLETCSTQLFHGQKHLGSF